MPVQDPSEIKEKILIILRQRGPSLPVHVAQRIGLSMLFAGAFLSELISDQKIKISHMKVGNSPIYFIPGQEPLIANFAQHLKTKEKEAFVLLKEKKFLKDTKQQPAIRVALRSLKDFAIPFKKNQEIYWRYLTVPESELKIKQTFSQKLEVPMATKLKIEKDQKSKVFEKKLDIFDASKKKPLKRKTPTQKTNEKFFNKVKDFLEEKSIEIAGIEGFSKNELILKVRQNQREELLVAYNKKRITEADIIKAHKRASEINLPYTILSLGEPTKKIQNFIHAIKDLSGLEKIK